MYNIIYIGGGERLLSEFGQCFNAHFEQRLKTRADDVKRQKEHEAHYQDEDRDRGELARQDLVDPLAPDAFFISDGFCDAFFYQLHDIRESHIGNSGRGI